MNKTIIIISLVLLLSLTACSKIVECPTCDDCSPHKAMKELLLTENMEIKKENAELIKEVEDLKANFTIKEIFNETLCPSYIQRIAKLEKDLEDCWGEEHDNYRVFYQDCRDDRKELREDTNETITELEEDLVDCFEDLENCEEDLNDC